MALQVYDRNKEPRAVLYESDSSSQQVGVQEDDILTLSLTSYECVRLEPGDFVEFLGARFWLVEAYTPKQASTVEWQYDVKFYGTQSIVRQALMLSSENVPLEAYTAPAREQLAMVVKNLNRWMGNITDWKVGDCISTENLVIDYSGGTYVNEALNKISDAAGEGAEWWMEGMTVNLSRCEHDEPIDLGYDNGLLSIERDNADNVKFFTRLFPVGSTKNIDPEKYGHSRLQLPTGDKYVERNTEEFGVIEHYEAEAFEKIFPRRTGHVSVVSSEPAKNDDGTEFTVYYFTDESLNFNPNDYEIGGLVKHVVFQDGELAGRDFEVNYNASTKRFEIITTFPYDDDTQVPGGLLVPKTGDAYILYNIRMPDEYYPAAEMEYGDAVRNFLETHSGMTDRSVFKCRTDYINLDQRGVVLTIGQRVRLVSDRYFPKTGYRESRITRITRNVQRPNEADIEISDVLSKTSHSRMQDSITTIRTEVKTATTTFPDIIKSWDNTLPTDNNLFSSRRSQKEFISKLKADTAKEIITYLKGVYFGRFEQGINGGCVDGEGNAEFLTAVIRGLLRSTKFVDGMLGEGFQLWMDKLTGLSNLTVDKVTIRQTLVALELLIEKVRSIGGQFIVSAANGKIKSVIREGDNYKIVFEQDNAFVAHDLMRCASFTGTIKGYWVEVSGSDSNGITVPVSEFSGVEPVAGDECVLMGNTENPLRQNLISIAATEDGQPRVDVLDGVKSKNFNGCLRVRFGNLDGIKDERFPLDNQPHGNGLYGDNAYLRGTFILMTGEDILTKFEIVEGKISSAVEGLRKEFTEDKSYLDNASFGDGMNKWDTENEATFFLLGDKWIWVNDAPLSTKTDYACVRNDDGRVTVYLCNKHIIQKHENFRFIPTYTDINDEGEKRPEAVYLAFFYRVARAGRLRIDFENADKTGFEDFNMFTYDGELEVTDGYQIFNHSGLWNGTGDFKLSFTGEIYLYMLVLSTDRAEALAYKYKTLFEQSEKLIKIAASNFDKDGNIIEGSQIVTKADMNLMASGLFDEHGHLVSGAGLITKKDAAGAFVVDENGNLKSLIGASVEGVKIKGDYITLEGLVTANNNFKILPDGSIETRNAKIYGTVYAYEGKIGGFTIESGRLYWKARDYFGNDSCSLKLGVSQSDMEGIVDVSFNAATQGKFGVKAVGSNIGGAAIYASSKSSGQSYPISANTYAGYFDGGVHVNGSVYCNDILSNNYGTGWSLASDGTYSYRKGISGTFQWIVKSDFATYKYTLEVVNGIVVKMTYI